MEVYVFNPEADLALAADTAHYIPPANVRQMAQDLALLPACYAPSGGFVLAASAYNEAFLESWRQAFGADVRLLVPPQLPEAEGAHVVPWGWNRALRTHLLEQGMREDGLPLQAELDKYRQMASRTEASALLRALAGLPGCGGRADNLRTLDDCRRYVEGTPGGSVLKAPWSGSGRGLRWCRTGFPPQVRDWCVRMLQTQGAVVASPLYDKVEDVAFEYEADGQGGVRYAGCSSFCTNSGGAYLGNRLLPADELRARLCGYLPAEVWDEVRRWHIRLLSRHYSAGGYRGYLGVDMMVCRGQSGGFFLHPCVEVNLRMNMGVVCCALQHRYLHPGFRGEFRIEYFPTARLLQERHQSDEARYPLVWRDGRVWSGYLPLVPVTPRSRYRAYVCGVGQ